MKSESNIAQQFILEQLQGNAQIQRTTKGRIFAPELEADEETIDSATPGDAEA